MHFTGDEIRTLLADVGLKFERVEMQMINNQLDGCVAFP